MKFEVIQKSGGSRARLGRLLTPHGVVETPCFMPVGTSATVKAIFPKDLEEEGIKLILANAYHLLFRPGISVIKEFGGLHQFMGWNGAILTDSGGFQVFSLSPFCKIFPEGVRFKSPVDGSFLMLTPESAIHAQMELGSDIVMSLDHCPPWPSKEKDLLEATRRTIQWAKRGKETWMQQQEKLFSKPSASYSLFGIIQGGTDERLRLYCSEELMKIGFDGYAIGGLSVGEPHEESLAVVKTVSSFLDEKAPKYVMGMGQPWQIVQMVDLGIDLFDCVLPTRLARHGSAYVEEGIIHIKNARFRKDGSPLDSRCSCYACRKFSRGYIHHLLKSKEILGIMLLSMHNLLFYNRLMKEIRSFLAHGQWVDFLARWKDKKVTK
ncbi:tRNA guanosine(34) transglycosylase Tgt [Candidatus Methylacidiphilum infernorum]|uniref:Queuine tRNA-ribosyltransferase n=1 Tax=Methylacidiphilum infernorum (isolate V4) TaxID=481448 RepID=TGT_METI4|nr:tRNA guanosine(34) transglycosylase Tgt [Candidatus Methylacidiphilum infernorum]B3DYE4.1 RecName: Full=Queuine tRNA-ribosyltransferase; AltName: Full=Guanine insertion enzyme; AltName: Full=tRNA-guanine transglycosylase [Methylacidiphilum infernorum V4]ACD83992.1 tRNA-guanine transglycosylase [Methylacidiphilum infernorum V4]